MFVGYLNDTDVIGPLCIILPQMSGYINILTMEEKTCYLKFKVTKYI